MLELAELVGVSDRNLQTLFNEHYQMGPRRCLKLRQRHKIHADLLGADPDALKVTDAMGRVAIRSLRRNVQNSVRRTPQRNSAAPSAGEFRFGY